MHWFVIAFLLSVGALCVVVSKVKHDIATYYGEETLCAKTLAVFGITLVMATVVLMILLPLFQ